MLPTIKSWPRKEWQRGAEVAADGWNLSENKLGTPALELAVCLLACIRVPKILVKKEYTGKGNRECLHPEKILLNVLPYWLHCPKDHRFKLENKVFFSPKPFHWAWDLISTASCLSYCVLSILESGSSSRDVGRCATLWTQHCIVNRRPRAREGCRRLTCHRPLSVVEELACLDLWGFIHNTSPCRHFCGDLMTAYWERICW